MSKICIFCGMLHGEINKQFHKWEYGNCQYDICSYCGQSHLVIDAGAFNNPPLPPKIPNRGLTWIKRIDHENLGPVFVIFLWRKDRYIPAVKIESGMVRFNTSIPISEFQEVVVDVNKSIALYCENALESVNKKAGDK